MNIEIYYEGTYFHTYENQTIIPHKGDYIFGDDNIYTYLVTRVEINYNTKVCKVWIDSLEAI